MLNIEKYLIDHGFSVSKDDNSGRVYSKRVGDDSLSVTLQLYSGWCQYRFDGTDKKKVANLMEELSRVPDKLGSAEYAASGRVTAIYPNKAKRVCAVKFGDGTVVVLRLSKGDKWDLHTAIAYAIAQKSLGGKTAFARYADSLIEAAEGKKKKINEGGKK